VSFFHLSCGALKLSSFFAHGRITSHAVTMPYYRRRRGFRLGMRRRRFGGPLRRTYGRRLNRYRGVLARALRFNQSPLTLDKDTTAVADATIDSGGVVIGALPAFTEDSRFILKTLYWRCALTWPATNGVGSLPMIRVIIFLDRRAASATPAVTDVLQTASVLAPLANDNRGRFKIISDRTFTASPSGNASDATGTGNTVPTTKFYKLYRRMNTYIRCTGTGYDRNALFVLAISSSDEIGAIDGQMTVGRSRSNPNTAFT